MKRIKRMKWPMIAFAGAVGLVTTGAMAGDERNGASLDDTRAVLGKWIETQQIIARERNDWQKGREILGGRIELLRKEFFALQEKLELARTNLKDAEEKRAKVLS